MENGKYKLLTIGQFAALHEINKKTLMWYDETGLFRPAVVKENGYRYYTYYQSSTLETILMLRELGVSVSEIKEFMEKRSAEKLENLLGEKMAELDRNILHLKEIRKVLVRQRKDLTDLINIDLSEIKIINKEEQYLAIVDTTKDMPIEEEIELQIAEIKKYRLRRMYDTSYGSMISVESLARGEFDNYSALFMKLADPSKKKGLHIQPPGSYMRAYYRGSWDRLPARYKELLAYAREQGLELHGYSYETGINETVIDSMDDYITQIEIPVASLMR